MEDPNNNNQTGPKGGKNLSGRKMLHQQTTEQLGQPDQQNQSQLLDTGNNSGFQKHNTQVIRNEMDSSPREVSIRMPTMSKLNDQSVISDENTPQDTNLNAQETLSRIQNRFLYGSSKVRLSSQRLTSDMIDDIGLADDQLFIAKDRDPGSSAHITTRHVSPQPSPRPSSKEAQFLRINQSTPQNAPDRQRMAIGEEETDKSSLLMDQALTPKMAKHDMKLDSIMGRQPYADIAHQTITDLGSQMQPTPKHNINKVDDFKITVGSIGIISNSREADDAAATTQPTISRALMGMVNSNLDKNIKSNRHIEDSNQTQQIKKQQITIQSNSSIAAMTGVGSTKLTKAEVSLENTNSVTDQNGERYNSNSALTQLNKTKFTSNSTFTQHAMVTQGFMQGSAQRLGGQEKMQLPALKGKNLLAEPNSQAMLLQNQSLTNEKMLAGRILNMQSQSPLRSLGLDVEGQGFQKKRQSEAAIFHQPKESLNQTMPPLQNLILTQSLASSRHQQRRGSVGYQNPVTPGQNWETNDLSVHAFVSAHQQNKKADMSTILEPNFLNQFTMKDLGRELHKRNVSRLTNLTDLAAQSTSGIVQSHAMSPIVQDLSNQIFDKVKAAPNFTSRSRSVISNATLQAYTPVKPHVKKDMTAATASQLQEKRHSSVAPKSKPFGQSNQKVKKLGYIQPGLEDQVNNTGELKYSPAINFPTNQLSFGPNREVTQKKVSGGFKGANRFEEGQKTLNMPGQVIEQWIDEVLRDDGIDINEKESDSNLDPRGKAKLEKAGEKASTGKAEKHFPGVGKVQRIKETQGASIRYGLDYQSLTKNGLSQEQVVRLQRAIYVHSVGFYDVIKECCKAAKNKKNILIGTLQVYQQVLEKCQKNEWKMLINEVANTYEKENDAKQLELKQTILEKDQIIAKVRKELQEQQEKLMKLESKVYSEQEAFARLHETYLILQNHNEEGLSLRLQTEGRLKDLFRRDRQQVEILKKTEDDRKEYRAKERESDLLLKELKQKVITLEELVREKEGINMVMKEEMIAQKRSAFLYKSQLQAMQAPQQMMQDQANRNKTKAEKSKAAAITANLKATSAESQLVPLRNQIQLLEKELDGARETSKLYEENGDKARTKMNEALSELTEKASAFQNVDATLAQKDREVGQAKSKLAINTSLMNAYQIEKDQYAEKLFAAEQKVKQLSAINDEQSSNIHNFAHHENDRERTMIDTLELNKKLREKNEILAQEVQLAETTRLFGLQQTIDEHEKRILELEDECETRKNGGEMDTKLAREEKHRLNSQIELLMDRQKLFKAELRSSQQQETRARQTNIDLLNRQTKMEAQEKQMNQLEQEQKGKVGRLTKRILELEEKIAGLKTMCQMYESVLERKKAKKNAYAARHREGTDMLHTELSKHQAKQNEAINQNNMVGEEYRSIALHNYNKIIEMQQHIICLTAEPSLHKERYLKLITQLRREGERHLMDKEDLRQEILRLHRVIDSKDLSIAQVENTAADAQFLVTVIKKKFGGQNFSIAHAGVQTGLTVRSFETQTPVVDNHVAIQAHGFASESIGLQTDPIEIKTQQSEQSDEDDHYQMPTKKLIKKKKRAAESVSPSLKRLETKKLDVQSPSKKSIGSIKSPRKESGQTALTARLQGALPTIKQKVKGSASKTKKTSTSISPAKAATKPSKALKTTKKLASIDAQYMPNPAQQQMLRDNNLNMQNTTHSSYHSNQDLIQITQQRASGQDFHSQHTGSQSSNRMATETLRLDKNNSTHGSLTVVDPQQMQRTSRMQELQQVREEDEIGKDGAQQLKGSKFKLEHRQLNGESSVEVMRTSGQRQGVYSQMSVKSTLETDHKQQMKRNQSIKGLLKSAVSRAL